MEGFDETSVFTFSPREPHWGNELLLAIDYVSSSRGRQETNSVASLGVLCPNVVLELSLNLDFLLLFYLILFIYNFNCFLSFYHTGPLQIYYGFQLGNFVGSQSVGVSGFCICICSLCLFELSPFVLSYSNVLSCSVIIILHYIA